MGEIVNLNRVKKQRAKAESTQLARESRVRHGRTKADKENDRRAAERRSDALAGKRVEAD